MLLFILSMSSVLAFLLVSNCNFHFVDWECYWKFRSSFQSFDLVIRSTLANYPNLLQAYSLLFFHCKTIFMRNMQHTLSLVTSSNLIKLTNYHFEGITITWKKKKSIKWWVWLKLMLIQTLERLRCHSNIDHCTILDNFMLL